MAIHELVPGEIFEPSVVAQLMRATPSKAHDGSSLDKLIHKISSLDRPPLWNFTFFDGGLLGKDLFPDGSAVPAHIGSSAHHQFEDDDSEGIVVDFIAVILLGHDFRSHIPRRSTSISAVFFPIILGDPEICEVDVACIVNNLPLESNTKFSGLMSLWMIFWECMYSREMKMQAAKKRVCSSVKRCFLQIWYLRSPPGIRSIIR